MIEKCSLCPRMCKVKRENSGSSRGFCKMPDAPVLARAALHFWEEPCISGKNGSGTVFFSGCSLGCVFCQNSEISAGGFGETVTEERLSEIFDDLISQGAHNINLVNPTHFAAVIRRVLLKKKPSVPVIYNSSGYERKETIRSLKGLVDVYLPDFKYIRSDSSAKYSGAEDYFTFAKEAVKEMAEQVGAPEYDENGMIKKGVIIRHLILPGHTNESIKVLEFIKENYPGIPVSLMCQYTPCGRAEEFPEINRKITKREYEKVSSAMFDLGFEDGFLQEIKSAGKKYIPDFDLTGIK